MVGVALLTRSLMKRSRAALVGRSLRLRDDRGRSSFYMIENPKISARAASGNGAAESTATKKRQESAKRERGDIQGCSFALSGGRVPSCLARIRLVPHGVGRL